MALSVETLAAAKAFVKKYVAEHGGDPSALGALAMKDSASGDYQPEGIITKPNVTVTETKKTVTPIKTIGTLPALSTTVTGKNVTIGFDKGALPEKGDDIEALTGVTAELAATPEFNGTQATITVE